MKIKSPLKPKDNPYFFKDKLSKKNICSFQKLDDLSKFLQQSNKNNKIKDFS
jgi:hypothetical protein